LEVDINTNEGSPAAAKAQQQFYNKSGKLASVIEKRVSLHRQLQRQQEESVALKSQISRLQALANIGTSTCMIAHEINNLLTPPANYAALALKNPDDKALAEKALQKAMRNCEQASKIMDSMLAVANGETEEKKDTPLSALVEEIFQCLCRDFAKDGITVKLKIPEDLKVRAVPVQIQQVLMNLILNAREAMLDRGGVLTIEAHTTADAVEIEVSDTGCGIAADDLKNIFEPFFTTKRETKSRMSHYGSGLGLAFCKDVIDAHGGCISVESKLDRGTSFKIILPKC
jgi:signal transduction histidine kinase